VRRLDDARCQRPTFATTTALHSAFYSLARTAVRAPIIANQQIGDSQRIREGNATHTISAPYPQIHTAPIFAAEAHDPMTQLQVVTR